jgi:hypothetical protein
MIRESVFEGRRIPRTSESEYTMNGIDDILLKLGM